VEKRTFTKRELRRYNGRNGAPAFIAYEGRIYDVSRSFLWQNGRHQAIHAAGIDLTSSLAEAPHGADVLKKFPIVGSLKEE
jgi:predicted heme/steroid binding protein